jgi:hypothetical protein
MSVFCGLRGDVGRVRDERIMKGREGKGREE